VVYILCALTSLTCVVLLARGYYRTRVRILLWSTFCFAFLAVNNVLLFIDLAVFGDRANLSSYRDFTAIVATSLIVIGLIWDSD
jgi:hypothetical protein